RPDLPLEYRAACAGVDTIRRAAQSPASGRHAQRHLSGAARTVDGATDDGDAAVGFSRRDAVAHQGQRPTHLSSDAVEYCAKAHPRTHGGAARYLCWTRYLILQNQFSFVRNVRHKADFLVNEADSWHCQMYWIQETCCLPPDSGRS